MCVLISYMYKSYFIAFINELLLFPGNHEIKHYSTKVNFLITVAPLALRWAVSNHAEVDQAFCQGSSGQSLINNYL